MRAKLAIIVGISLLGLVASTFIVSVADSSGTAPTTMWTRTYGKPPPAFNEAYSVVQTSDGGYALAGTAGATGSPYADMFGDFWLVKTDSTGNMLWNRTYGVAYGGARKDVAYSVVQTSDGGYALAGYTNLFGTENSDFWLVKTDSSGNAQWNKTYGGTDFDGSNCVIQTGDGGYALAGSTNSYGAGGDDFWLVKTDSTGTAQWNKTYGGTGGDAARSVVQTSDGYALAGGGFANLVKTDENGNQQWNKTYGDSAAYSVIQTGDGGYALAGYIAYPVSTNADFWLVRTDSSGTMQWNKTYGGTGYDVARSVIQTTDGGYAMTGVINRLGSDKGDFWLVKVDSSGNTQWDQTYGGTGVDEAWSVIQTTDGGYAVAGWTASFGADADSFWLVKTEAAGVVPEFPSFLLLPLLVLLLVIFTGVVVVLLRKKLLREKSTDNPKSPPFFPGAFSQAESF